MEELRYAVWGSSAPARTLDFAGPRRLLAIFELHASRRRRASLPNARRLGRSRSRSHQRYISHWLGRGTRSLLVMVIGQKPNDGAGAGGEKTPGGRKLSGHAEESLRRHGFREPFGQVDDIIENASRTTSQADGATVYIQRAAGRGRTYSIAIVNELNEIVTAMRNLTPHELRAREWTNQSFSTPIHPR